MTAAAADSRLQRIMILAALPLFSILRFGLLQGSIGVLDIPISVAIYFLTVYIFYGIAWLAYLRTGYPLWITLVAAVIVGYLLGGKKELWVLVTTWTTFIFGSVIAGRMNIDRYKQTPIYIAGVAAVAIVTVAQFYPDWPLKLQALTAAGNDMIESMRTNLSAMNADESMMADGMLIAQKAVNITIRLMPASILLSLIVQFTLGYLLFLRTVDKKEFFLKRLRPFVEWKAPFAIMPIVMVAVVLKLMAGETGSLIADNALAVLSVFYCATGLALMESILQRLKVPFWMKLLFYLLLLFTHVIGYLVTVLLGFVDSFADWRRIDSKTIV